MSLLDLPYELLLQIFDRQYDFNTLSQVSRQFHHHFNDKLYLYNIKYRNSRGLFWAAEEGRVSVTRKFLSLLEPNVNTDTEYPYDKWIIFTHPRQHKTCLDLAIAGGHLEIVQLLLEHGADPLRINDKGQAPLFLALVSGHDGIIKLISSYINEFSNYVIDLEKRYTPLHIASRYGLSHYACYFLEHGADVNAKDANGWTALRHVLATDLWPWPLGVFENVTTRAKKSSPIQILETMRVLIEFKASPGIFLSSGYQGESPLVTTAYLGARNMNPKVRALFSIQGDTPSSEKEVADTASFSPDELK